jgi:hypothetical protein
VQNNSTLAGRSGPAGVLLDQVFLFGEKLPAQEEPAEVLATLGEAIHDRTPLKVLGAARFPVHSYYWRNAKLGETVFLSKNSPRGWWPEYGSLAATYLPVPGAGLAHALQLGRHPERARVFPYCVEACAQQEYECDFGSDGVRRE